MTQEFYTLVTDIGIAKFTNAQITQTAVNLSHVAVGDGDGKPYNPTQKQTALVNERWRGQVSSLAIDEENENYVNIEVTIPSSVGGWMIREIGVFDDEGDLILISKQPETFKPTFSMGSVKDMIIKLVMELSNTDVAEIKIDPTIITASRAYVDKNLAEVDGRLTQQLVQNDESLEDLDNKTPWAYPNEFTTASLQAKVTAATNGSTIMMKPGRYLVTNQVTWSGKELHIMTLGNVVFVEQTPINVPIIHATNCGKSTFTNLNCEGAETLTNFSGADEKHYCFIKLTNGKKAKIYSTDIKDKTYGVILENCESTKVLNIDMNGFLATGSLSENGANFSSAVRILGGKNNKVKDFTAINIGSAVSSGGDGKAHVISDGYVENARDNGVYISSGQSVLVDKVHIASAVSSGVKVRGSKHKISSCEVNNALVGFALSGNGATADSQGYNGFGNECINNIAVNCSSLGISVPEQDGLYGRDFKILENTLVNCGGTESNLASIRVLRGIGHQIKGNIIDGTNSDFAIFLSSVVGQPIDNVDVSDNLIRNAKTGIRTLYVTSSKLNNNVFKNLTSTAIDCRFTTNSDIINNDYAAGQVVSVSTTYTNTGNKVYDNRGLTLGNTGNVNYFKGNIPTTRNFESTISNIPYFVGQRALVSGILYESIGTTATTDWKQISNA